MTNLQPIDFAWNQATLLEDVTLRLHPSDQVVIAKMSLQAGTRLIQPAGSIDCTG